MLTLCFANIIMVSAQVTSAQVASNATVSLEMQAQIQEALRQQSSPVPQNLNRALGATYVGSFNTDDGPNWNTNPAALSAVQAAALIFGGSPSDYAISTNSNTIDPMTITNTAWATSYAVAGCQEVAEDYSLDLGAPGYSEPSVVGAGVSSYVQDNCISGNTNYVWLVGGSSSDFITTWQTTTSSESITIPTTGSGYNYSVDWGDGNSDTGLTGNASHTYASAGVYTVKISGAFPRIFFNNGGDRKKIKSIEQWGTNTWTSMRGAFAGAENLVSNATDIPDLSMVTDMYGMFAYASKFNGDSNMNNWDVSNVTNMFGMFGGASVFNRSIGNWDVSNVTNMQDMFRGATKFNKSIGNWNVGSVTNMRGMFGYAMQFNQNLNNWNVSNVITMYGMFGFARKFNGAIGDWNVSNVNNMYGMFGGASVFNKDISNWNVGNVINMEKMFDGATVFNQNIGSWNVGSVTNMRSMFSTALGFNQNIGGWNVSNVTKMALMFNGVTLSTPNYDALLNGWSMLSLKNGVVFGAGNSKYCTAEVARDNIITSYGWTINDDGQVCGPSSSFITTWMTTSSNESITIPTFGSGYSYDINWGDGSATQVNQTGSVSHIYNTAGLYTVTIQGSFPRIYFNNSGDRLKIQSIEQWGANAWNSMNGAFAGCENLVSNALDRPKLSMVTDMFGMFAFARKFNGDAMINTWNVSNVTNMSGMFGGASVFNQDIGNWNTGNVVNMENMFNGATMFNQDIGNWNVESVVNMKKMFEAAFAFNQDIGSWDVSNVTNMTNMFAFAKLSTANYDALLNGWNTLPLQNGVNFNAGNSTYCTGEAAKANIISTFGWTISDGGRNCINPCGNITEYTMSGWSNGAPTISNKAIFSADYNSALDGGSIEACGIVINPGVTVTVSPGNTIRAEYNMDIANSGNLIFESDATGNGELGILGSDAVITGNATVQRYMSANRSYRMVTSAVTTPSTTSIHDFWQESANSKTDNPAPGFGTHITGTTVDQQNGFDGTSTGNPSMFVPNVAMQQYDAISNTDNINLTAGIGYLMFIRGDRGIDLTSNTSVSETVLRATGELVVGSQSQSFTSPSTGAFVMFGNPYQSAVDVNDVVGTSTNVNTNEYYVYDPTLGSNGAYVTVSLPSGTNTSGSSANQYLQPGQAAQFATLMAGPVEVDFQEAYKTPGNFTATNATGNSVLLDGMLVGQLYTQENYANAGPIHDSFMMHFNSDNNSALTVKDAVKPMNFYENIGVDHDGTYLSIERRDLPESGEIFPLYTNGYQFTEYVLKMELNGLDNVSLYLNDSYTGESTLLQQGLTAYSFTIDQSNPESKSSTRFSIRVGESLGVNSNELLSGITLYPNPMGDKLNLGNPINLKLESASIYDLTGRLIQKVNLKGATSEMTVDVSALSIATYLVVIDSEAGQMSKLMIKK